MKSKNKIIVFLFVVLAVSSIRVFAGEKTSFVDDYRISSIENFEPGNVFQQSWEITYGESQRPVQILLKETRKGDEYIVRTKYFEVKYVNSENGFGACPMKVSESIVPVALNSQVINPNQMSAQKIITKSQVDNEKALQLIAGFLPELVNEQYKNILN